MIKPPQDTDNEKNICSAALRQTVISIILSKSGLKNFLEKEMNREFTIRSLIQEEALIKGWAGNFLQI